MALNLNYGDRKAFFGNSGLLIGRIDKTGATPKASGIQLVTGLVEVSELSESSEASNYFADDQLHATKKGASLLEGEMVFTQIDEPVAQGLLGQVKSENGLGWVETGNYSDSIVQYVNQASKKTADGEIVNGYKIIVFPCLKATGEGTSESSTDSVEGVDPINYTIPVNAQGTADYKAKGKTPAKMEYEVWGEQATAFEQMMEEELFIMFPDTVIGE